MANVLANPNPGGTAATVADANRLVMEELHWEPLPRKMRKAPVWISHPAIQSLMAIKPPADGVEVAKVDPTNPVERWNLQSLWLLGLAVRISDPVTNPQRSAKNLTTVSFLVEDGKLEPIANELAEHQLLIPPGCLVIAASLLPILYSSISVSLVEEPTASHQELDCMLGLVGCKHFPRYWWAKSVSWLGGPTP